MQKEADDDEKVDQPVGANDTAQTGAPTEKPWKQHGGQQLGAARPCRLAFLTCSGRILLVHGLSLYCLST